ncbi:G2 and S phase-expressed protein 1 isoform X2 [Chaetodon trifascialis]|uniref:G2 and S phase-expressed protein 1 isoform X2 n=1 Tax=Chaetodon trifascialis TaxID=109706 RepID=UPI0039942A60
MNCRANSDLLFLPDEKFDFDVSLSPASSKGDEDEDEVFVGPVSHKERCVSVDVLSRLEDSGGGVQVSWSPLTEDQLEAVCQEAHRLADWLQTGEKSCHNMDDKTSMTTDPTTDTEEFIQDAEAKLGVLSQSAIALSPIKRQTFCVQDSPMKQLPPAVQCRLLRESNTALSTRHTSGNRKSFTRPVAPARLSTSSPVAKAQHRTGLRGKATLGVVLPSKLVAPTTSCSASKSRVEKTRLQPLGKTVGGRKPCPVSRPSSKAKSCEDLLSDSASMASDISDSSLNSSLLAKCTWAPPTKSIMKNLSVVSAPSLQSKRVADRKNTSSSSSSVSSFNSSLCLSPAKGKLNSSLNRSMSGSTGPTPSSMSKPINHSRPRRSTVYSTTEPASSTTGRPSLSAQARKQPEVDCVKATRSTPLQLTPAKRDLERTAMIPTTASAQLQSGPKTKSKPQALIPPTHSGSVRGLSIGDDVSKTLKPKRLISVGSVDSLPKRPSAGPLTPSAGSCRLLQVTAQRPSTLPTPVRRRMSTIPVATPTNLLQAARPPPTADTASARRERGYSPAITDTQEVKPVDAPDIQPFCLEEEPPAAPLASPLQPNQSESTDPGAPNQGESEPSRNLIELQAAEESTNKTQEVLLLDLPAPSLQPPEKLLIDLTNTPDLIRTSSKPCTTSQLIDLSSPLIKWSPEDKRENNAPLINLSF